MNPTHTQRRWRAGRASTAVLAGATVALGLWPMASPVHADSPVQQTWWTVNNVTVDLPVPPDVFAPGAIPPVTIPSTDVPDGGSEVAGTTDSPTGALTLRYEFTDGSELGPLVLTVAESTPVAPGTELVACGLVGDGRFETYPGGGPISKLPEHDCAASVKGVLGADATTFTFQGIGELAAEEHLSVVVLPVAARVVLERASGDSLPVVEPDLDVASPPFRAPSPPTAPTGGDPKPFLGQVVPEVAAPPLAATPPSPDAAPATAPDTGPREVASRLVTVFRGTPAGQSAGSAVAGTVLVLLGAQSVWRRGRSELELAITRTSAP